MKNEKETSEDYIIVESSEDDFPEPSPKRPPLKKTGTIKASDNNTLSRTRTVLVSSVENFILSSKMVTPKLPVCSVYYYFLVIIV